MMNTCGRAMLAVLWMFILPVANAPGQTRFEPNWQSLKQYQCPQWFRDAKFGIFMHWGVNTVSEYDDHYGRYMYIQDPSEIKKSFHKCVYQHHVKTYGHPSVFGYKDFIPMWKAQKWDPDELVRFYKQIGARYIVPVAVHCDNFDNYDSSYQPWNSVKMGPKQDIVGRWKQAAEKHGLRFVVSSHLGDWVQVWYSRACDKTGPLAGVPYDVCDPNYAGLYGDRGDDRSQMPEDFPQNWYLRTKELIDKYRPDLLYFDSGLPYDQYGLKIAAHFYNANMAWHGGQLQAVLNVKRDFEEGAIVYDIEKGQAKELLPLPWQTDTTINSGWFYQTRQYGHGYEMPSGFCLDETVLIDNLVDIVSKNGNLLLNIGLRADGTLPDDQRRILQELGDWLAVNGEAIYQTRPWIIYGEGPTKIETGFDTEPRQPWSKKDIRFTTKGEILYAIALDWPGWRSFTVKSLSDCQAALGPIESVTLLGHKDPLKWKRDKKGLTIFLPREKPCKYAFVFKITPAKSPDKKADNVLNAP